MPHSLTSDACRYFFVMIPKFMVAFGLWWYGVQFLLASSDHTELILNGVALGFILVGQQCMRSPASHPFCPVPHSRAYRRAQRGGVTLTLSELQPVHYVDVRLLFLYPADPFLCSMSLRTTAPPCRHCSMAQGTQLSPCRSPVKCERIMAYCSHERACLHHSCVLCMN